MVTGKGKSHKKPQTNLFEFVRPMPSPVRAGSWGVVSNVCENRYSYIPSPIRFVLCWTSLLLSNAELQNNNINEHETEHVARIGIILLIMVDFLAIIRHVYNLISIQIIAIEQYSPPPLYNIWIRILNNTSINKKMLLLLTVNCCQLCFVLSEWCVMMFMFFLNQIINDSGNHPFLFISASVVNKHHLRPL